MRRSICYCEPSHVRAGMVGTWRFIHTTAQTLPKGTKLWFDIHSHGRDVEWEIPQTDLKKKNNVIFIEMEDGAAVAGKKVEIPNHPTPLFEFTLPEAVSSGDSFQIVMGSKESQDKTAGNRVQTTSQRRRTFSLFIDPTGKQKLNEPEVFSLDILGGELDTIRLLTPSLVGKNKRFDIIVRFEDKYGNLTGKTQEDTLIELSYEQLRESLNWKLFVPETGFISLPNLYFNETGVYTIKLKNLKNKKVYHSPPIRCSEDSENLLMWGLLHGESKKISSAENIDGSLRHMRDEKFLNFFALSPFDEPEETSNELWKTLIQLTQEFDEEDRFSTFLGFQRIGTPQTEGVRHILYLKDQKQLIRQKDAKGSSLEKLYKSFSPKEMISIPTLTMGKGYSFDFKAFDPEFERVVEIYNGWGSSEGSKKEGNSFPIQHQKTKKGLSSVDEGAILQALNKNCRFGFVAGGLENRGVFGNLPEAGQTEYAPGLTAVISKGHSKGAIAEALYNRSCYATTGERIVIEFAIAGAKMGQEVTTAEKPGLAVNRHIKGFVAGAGEIDRVEIIRNGEVIHSLSPSNSYWTDFNYDDAVQLDQVTFPSKGGKPPFVYYFLKVIQKDGHVGWSSPIWIDIVSGTTSPKRKGQPKVAEKVKEILEIKEEEDEEEEE